jgi:FKBP-type peptidyl-prolyl cis-trans isomerase FklB
MRALTIVVGLAVMMLMSSCDLLGKKSVELKSQKDKVSYCVGIDMGKMLKQQKMDVDVNILLEGMKDSYQGNKPRLDEKEVQTVMTAFQQDMMLKQQEGMKKDGEANLKAGAEFLEKNKKEKDVVTLPSGLQYKVLRPGVGKKPTKDDMVVCQYRGTLIDGTEFDNSYKTGQPVTFPVGRVIPGWTEGLQLMQEGAQWRLFIPPSLGYGERGAGPNTPIGPNVTLIFDVELIKIQPAGAAAAAATAAPKKK